MKKIKLTNGLRWFWITVVVLLLDRVTKYFAQKYLLAYYAVPVVPGFNLTLSFNTGSAFGFLNSQSGWQVWFFGLIALIVSVGILCWLARLSSRERWIAIALSFIVGGALGNLWDRISYGHVIDFIQLYISHYYWPTFNIADSAICIGAALLFGQAILNPKK
jgi:signal peptidase II